MSRHIIGTIAVLGALSIGTQAHAGSGNAVFGAVVGSGAGAVIGGSIGGTDGAIIGGVIGAAAGAAVASNQGRYDGHAGYGAVRVHGPVAPVYGPPPVVYYPPPPVAVYPQPVYGGGVYPAPVYGRPVYPAPVYAPPVVVYRGWRWRGPHHHPRHDDYDRGYGWH